MKKWLAIGVGVAFVALVPGGGIAALIAASARYRDRRRVRMMEEERIRVAAKEHALRTAPVC